VRACFLALVAVTVGLLMVTSAAPGARTGRVVRLAQGSRNDELATAQGSLALNASFRGKADGANCPAGTPATTECYLNEGTADVPGLGSTSLRYTILVDLPNGMSEPCRLLSTPNATFTVSGKGEIKLSARNSSCQSFSNVIAGTMDFTITGGSGAYASATGSGTVRIAIPMPGTTSTWTGTLSVPGVDFDTTPPTISGASNKVVKVKKTARRARVAYSVTASDAVDGTIPVTCLPRSGAFFRVGKTPVRCSATDSSANTAVATFSVIVKRR